MEIFKLRDLDVRPFMDRLSHVYADMDQAYAQAADYYGFNCEACKDICCQTRFYHHTYVEYLYLRMGFETLPHEQRAEVKTAAKKVSRQAAALDKIGKTRRLMCPLNVEKLCLLYPYRPMICRLHGIPHELQKGAANRISGPGCETFDSRCSKKPYFQFDRTPFYRKMAALENELRQTTIISGKIKMTIAEMITSIAQSK
jgi:Fe-S-cluster containining protein